jgi:hypothetical protein
MGERELPSSCAGTHHTEVELAGALQLLVLFGSVQANPNERSFAEIDAECDSDHCKMCIHGFVTSLALGRRLRNVSAD